MDEINSTVEFNDLAERYKFNKRNALCNILEAGKILNEARDKLTLNQFNDWLQDFRVNESIRTAQRLISVYKNYGHILETDKVESLSQIGITALLELQKLPDRFKKEIEVVKITEEGPKKELREVIDEDKLSTFLNEVVETKEGMKPVKDLSISEMRKVINNASGIYEPESYFDDEESKEIINSIPPVPVVNGSDVHIVDSDKFGECLALFPDLSGSCLGLVKSLDSLSDGVLLGVVDNEKEKFKEYSKTLKSALEALHVKIAEVESRLENVS